MTLTLSSLLLGGLVGLILALSGAGAGILAVPLLVFGLHLGIAQAAPVGLIAVGTASALGALLGHREGQLRYRAAALIGLTGMLLAPLGVRLALVIPNTPLTLAFALVLAGVAWRMFRQVRLPVTAARQLARLPCVLNPDEGRLIWTLPCAWALAATGAVSGLLSGLLGVGGGFVIVPALTRYTNIATRSIVVTSMAVIALVSVGSVTAAAAHGAVSWPIAAPFASGAVLALLAGRQLAARLAGTQLQLAFAFICALVSLLLLGRGLGWIAG